MRLWFLNEDRSELIQVQQDRFIHNWQKVEGKPYPRYLSRVRLTFEEEYERFTDFLNEAGIGLLEALECEVSYINHIKGADLRTHRDLPNIMPAWTGQRSDTYLPEPDDVGLYVRYTMSDGEQNRGRLTVSVLPGFSKGPEQEPMYRMTLTALAKPKGSDPKAVLECLDMEHDWVVNGFVSITSKTMHGVWEKEHPNGG